MTMPESMDFIDNCPNRSQSWTELCTVLLLLLEITKWTLVQDGIILSFWMLLEFQKNSGNGVSPTLY